MTIDMALQQNLAHRPYLPDMPCLNAHIYTYNMSHVMRKPVFAICAQQRRRSACASAQSDKRLCYLLSKQYNTSSFYIRNFKSLPSFCGLFEPTLVANPEDRFSRGEAQLLYIDHRSHLSEGPLLFKGISMTPRSHLSKVS